LPMRARNLYVHLKVITQNFNHLSIKNRDKNPVTHPLSHPYNYINVCA
jgi:hypothetical protein